MNIAYKVLLVSFAGGKWKSPCPDSMVLAKSAQQMQSIYNPLGCTAKGYGRLQEAFLTRKLQEFPPSIIKRSILICLVWYF